MPASCCTNAHSQRAVASNGLTLRQLGHAMSTFNHGRVTHLSSAGRLRPLKPAWRPACLRACPMSPAHLTPTSQPDVAGQSRQPPPQDQRLSSSCSRWTPCRRPQAETGSLEPAPDPFLARNGRRGPTRGSARPPPPIAAEPLCGHCPTPRQSLRALWPLGLQRRMKRVPRSCLGSALQSRRPSRRETTIPPTPDRMTALPLGSEVPQLG